RPDHRLLRRRAVEHPGLDQLHRRQRSAGRHLPLAAGHEHAALGQHQLRRPRPDPAMTENNMRNRVSGPAGPPPSRGSEAGFTLVEALVAIVILVFGLIAVTNLMLVAASSNSVANQ